MNQEIIQKLAKFSKSVVIEDNLLVKPDSVCIVSYAPNWEKDLEVLKQRPERFKEMFVYGNEAPTVLLENIRDACKKLRYAVTFEKNLVKKE